MSETKKGQAPYYRVWPAIEWEPLPPSERRRIDSPKDLEAWEREFRNFEDEELEAVVRRMTPGDKLRFEELYQELNPAMLALREIQKIGSRPAQLKKTGGAPGPHGRNPIEREVARVVIRRLFDSCLGALEAPGTSDAETLTASLLKILNERLELLRGPLEAHFISPADVLLSWVICDEEGKPREEPDAVIEALRSKVHQGVTEGLDGVLPSETPRVRAMTILLEVLESLGVGMTGRNLETYLSKTGPASH